MEEEAPVEVGKKQQQKLALAIADFEEQVDCEVVLVIARSSNRYYQVHYLGALLGSLLTFSLLQIFWPETSCPAFIYLAGMLVGISLSMIPGVKLWCVGSQALNEEVAESAAAAFLRHNLHRTSHRRGILIYLSLFERRIEVIGDLGIEQVLGGDVWQQVIKDFQSSLSATTKKNHRSMENLTQALEEVLASLSRKLHAHFPRTKENHHGNNQLTNWPVIE